MRMDRSCILMHMRTTLIIEDGLLDRAREISGISEKTAVVRAGLEALIAREAAKRAGFEAMLARYEIVMPELRADSGTGAPRPPTR